jgi:hypothetical protein
MSPHDIVLNKRADMLENLDPNRASANNGYKELISFELDTEHKGLNATDEASNKQVRRYRQWLTKRS